MPNRRPWRALGCWDRGSNKRPLVIPGLPALGLVPIPEAAGRQRSAMRPEPNRLRRISLVTIVSWKKCDNRTRHAAPHRKDHCRGSHRRRAARGRCRRGRADGAPHCVGVVEQSGRVGRLAGKSAGALRKWRIRTSTHRCQTASLSHCPGRGHPWTPICSSGHRRGVRHAGGLRCCKWTRKSPGRWHDISWAV